MANRRRLFLTTYSVVSGSLGARVPAEGSLLMLSRAHALLGGRGEVREDQTGRNKVAHRGQPADTQGGRNEAHVREGNE